MKNIIHKYGAVFLLALFLFPFVEKELHGIDHADDFHCTASEKHIHEQEHHCSICDFIVLDVFSAPVADNKILVTVQSFKYLLITEHAFSPSAFSDTPLRAPPFSLILL